MLAMSLASPVALPLNAVAPGAEVVVFLEVELSRSGVVISLQKIVADAANVGACLSGCGCRESWSSCWQSRYWTRHAARAVTPNNRSAGTREDVCREGDLPAARGSLVRSVGAIAGDAKRRRIILSIVCLLRRVAQMGQTDARFGKQRWREDMIVVETGAVGRCDSGRFKSSACRARRGTSRRAAPDTWSYSDG